MLAVAVPLVQAMRTPRLWLARRFSLSLAAFVTPVSTAQTIWFSQPDMVLARLTPGTGGRPADACV